MIFSCQFPSWAETTPSQLLTLEQALDLALRNNPQVQAAQARLGISQAEILTASARLNPQLVSDNGIAEKTYRLGIQQTIELGGKRKHRIQVAQAQRQVVLAEINTVLLDVRANVRRSYTQLFNSQERQLTFQEILQTTEKLLEVAQIRERAGDIASLDVLQAEISVVNARNEVQNSNFQVIQARNTLNAFLLQPLNASLVLAPPTIIPQLTPGTSPPPATGTLPLKGSVNMVEPEMDQLIQDALARRPEIKQNLSSQEVTQRQLALAKANRIPNFTLASGPDLVTETGQKEVNVFVIGTLELPLFNLQQGPIKEALARRIQLEREQVNLNNRITLEVTNAYTSFLASQDRVKRYEVELLPKAQEVVDKSRRSFEVGKSSILIPINAQQSYINTRLGYLQALLDYQNAISDLERAVGTGL